MQSVSGAKVCTGLLNELLNMACKFVHASTQVQPRLSTQSLTQVQSQLVPLASTQAQPQLSGHVPATSLAQLSPEVLTHVAIPASAQESTQAPAQAVIPEQGVAASVTMPLHAPPLEPSLAHCQAQGLTASSTPLSQAELQQKAELPIATIVGLTAKVNSMLVGPHQLSKSQAEQMQAAFGDVKLMQDLRHMEGDLLNGQLRAAAGLNALQICVVRQVLRVLQ